MTTYEKVCHNICFLEDLAHERGDKSPVIRKALSELHAELFVLDTRAAYPINGDEFFVAFGGKIFRCAKEKA